MVQKMTDQNTKEINFRFYKSLSLVVIFFLITPILIGTSLFALFSLKAHPLQPKVLAATESNLIKTPQSGVSVYASLPAQLPSISGTAETADAREELIRQYLKAYHSPLEPYSNILVSEADKYKLDYRLLVAIAQQESNLCKIIPAGTYNCWGWGIHSKGTLGFSSFEEGIETVAAGIKENYLDQGLTTIDEIMSKYTPMSEGSWSFAVNKFMQEMETPSE
jgi:hypothetical protein